MHLLINRYSRILYNDNGVYTDYSEDMRSWITGSMVTPLTLSEDYIYIGSPYPFASRFVLMDSTKLNDVSATLTVEYYYGKSLWRSVKNFRNESSYGGVPFSRSGFMMWDMPDDWEKNQVNSLPELPYNENSGDGKGYYWIRIKSSATLKVTTALKWLGLIWTSQDYMKVKWPEVDSTNYLPTGKTDWYELIEMSTGDVADDLNIANVIDYELQATDIDEMAKLTALKTMINILIPMTSSETLRMMKNDFELEYQKLLKKRLKGIDQNQDGKVDSDENRPMSNSRIIRY